MHAERTGTERTDDVHYKLVYRSEQDAQSVQQFPAAQPELIAEIPTRDEICDVVDSRPRDRLPAKSATEAIGQ